MHVSDRQTFLFADIVGFTALTTERGDEAAARVAVEVCRAIRALLPDHGGSEVKAMGDGLLARVEDPELAIALGVRIVLEVGGRPDLPPLRVGMEAGRAVSHDGDWYGATVNVAARICHAARPGEVLVGPSALGAAGGYVAGLRFRPRRLRRLKNLPRPLVAYAAAPAGVHASLRERVHELACPRAAGRLGLPGAREAA
jgi:class 3 adenylate cyclase